MPIIKHKFRNRQISLTTEILVIGTFNPDTEGNNVTFFYGRPRNFLWKYLPLAFNEECLKYQDLDQKMAFMDTHNIDFVDLIKSVDVEEGQELNVDDKYIDNKVVEWVDILEILNNLPNLRKVIFTRSTFNGIPNILQQVNQIETYCDNNGIDVIRMISPARFWRQDRQNMWNNFIGN